MSRRSPPPHMARHRSRSPISSHHGDGRERERDGGYGARLGSGQASGSGSGGGRRYDPRDDRDRRGGPSRGGGSGEYGSREREAERRNERSRYDEGARRDWGDDDEPPPPKSPPKPNFKPSGLLAKETNTVYVSKTGEKESTPSAGTKGVVLKYNEPPEARKPTQSWRLFVFKGAEQVDMIHLHRQSAYLVGRDQVVSDIPIAHPSASKQHAVIQFRQMTERNEFGDTKMSIKPFIIDLDSTNGTFVNDQEIPTSRYYELRQSDILKFAQSTREYVLLHEENA